jgi:hypothetical protein
MKIKFFIILGIFGLSSLHAQVQMQIRDFRYYNSQIDSIVSAYSTEEYRDVSAIRLTFHDFGLKANLNVKERKKLIGKIKRLFEQDKYTNLYYVGHKLISKIWDIYPIPNSPEIQQILLELYLQYYFYLHSYDIISESYYDLNEIEVYTKKMKKRIVEILEGKKTGKEYEIFKKFYEISSVEFETVTWELAARLMKEREVKNATVLKQIRDSILDRFIIEGSTRNFAALQAKPSLIKMTGFLGMKECIPILQQQLDSCIENRCIDEKEYALRYALARLGDSEQRQYIWNVLIDIKMFDREDFTYFRDDELIWHYIAVNYASGKRISVLSDTYIGADLLTMNNVYPYVKNVPEKLKYSTKIVPMSEEYAWAKLFYEWLMENKDMVEFDYDGEKKWFW